MAAIIMVPRSIVTLTTTGASLTGNSAGSAGTDMDFRAAGNFAGDWQVQFELVCQWATVTGISANGLIGLIYLVPKMDGTNAPDIDTTAGASVLPQAALAATITAAKAPTANTDMRFISAVAEVPPRLYTAYLLNRSGQTISANWSLKAIGDQGAV